MGAGYTIKASATGAEIYIYEDIGDSWFGGVTAKQFADDLKALGPVSTIDCHINSGGGDVFDGVAIYRQLVDHKAKVITHIDGLAASIASVIAMAGDEILITEAGFVMIHEASSIVVGTAVDMRRRAETLDTVTAAIADVYVARTKSALTDIKAWMADETWMTAADAVSKGFADSVVENLRIAARYDPSRHTFSHAPAELLARSALPTPPGAARHVAPLAVAPALPPASSVSLRARVELQRAQLAARLASAS